MTTLKLLGNLAAKSNQAAGLTPSCKEKSVPQGRGVFGDESFPLHHRDEQPRAPSNETKIKTVEELRTFLSNHVEAIQKKAWLIAYGKPDAAQEIVQELFPKLVRALATSDDGFKNVWAVIHTVAKRLSIDIHRRESRRRHPSLDVTFCELEPLHRSENQIDFSAVKSAMQSIPPRLRQVIVETYYDGRRGKDVALRLGLSEARVSELKRNALKLLRGKLSTKGEG